MSTLTTEQEDSIRNFLDQHPNLVAGLGTKEAACSIAAINLALTGELTDRIPDCMSKVIGRWIIRIQDSMPDSIRQSPEWRALLPLAAGTGREKERERLDIILDWMWDTILPTFKPIADKYGFGAEWSTMLTERTGSTARIADVYDAAKSADYAAKSADYAVAAADYAAAAYVAAYAADYAVAVAAYVADYAADYADAYADVAKSAADAAAYAADYAVAYYAKSVVATWLIFDPVGLLKRLIEAGNRDDTEI